MNIWSFLRPRVSAPIQRDPATEPGLSLSPYVAEYVAAIDRTEAFGFEPPRRMLVRKDCVDLKVILAVLLEYFARSSPDAMSGQTAAINFALVPLLYDKTGIPFNLTIGWVLHKETPIYQHDEHRIEQFLKEHTAAWL